MPITLPVQIVGAKTGTKWPKHLYREKWAKFFAPLFNTLRVKTPIMTNPDLWIGGHHLPGMFRAGGTNIEPPKVTGSAKLNAPDGVVS